MQLPAALEPTEGRPLEARTGSGRRVVLTTLVIGAVLVLGLLAAKLGLWGAAGQGVGSRFRSVAPHEVPLTSERAVESMPAVSPNGLLVAYSANSRDPSMFDVWVTQRGGGAALRLTESPEEDLFPTWSPDGSRLAFARQGGDAATICEVPALGGSVRQLATAGDVIEGLSWSPDGSELVFSSQDGRQETLRLFRLELETLEVHELTDPPGVFVGEISYGGGDTDPEHSPDGRQIAFVRRDAAGRQDVWLVPSTGGPARRLTADLKTVQGLTWMPSGSELIVAAAPRGRFLLWRVRLDDGSRTWLPTLYTDSIRPSLDRSGRVMVYANRYTDTDIWRHRLLAGPGNEPMVEPVIISTSAERWPMPSYDGSRLLFVSNRTGRSQVWVADADGSNLRQLTSFDGRQLERPKWSPDGSRIALSTFFEQHLAVHVIDVATGRISSLAPVADHEQLLDWSPDGEWIYYDVAEGPGWELWRRRVDGGEPEPVDPPRRDLGTIRFFGPDMYYTTTEPSGLWAWPLAGGEARLVVPVDIERHWLTWVPTERGIYFVKAWSDQPLVHLYDPATGRSRPTDSGSPRAASVLVFYRDGSCMLVDRLVRVEADLILLEDPADER